MPKGQSSVASQLLDYTAILWSLMVLRKRYYRTLRVICAKRTPLNPPPHPRNFNYCSDVPLPTQCGPVLARDDLHRGDDLLDHRGRHGGGVQGAVGVAAQVVDQLLGRQNKV